MCSILTVVDLSVMSAVSRDQPYHQTTSAMVHDQFGEGCPAQHLSVSQRESRAEVQITRILTDLTFDCSGVANGKAWDAQFQSAEDDWNFKLIESEEGLLRVRCHST